MQKIQQKGFTLVELLVVIAIIGVLVAIIFVALDPAARFKQARDAVRQNAVQNILSAIKLNQVDNAGSHLASITALAPATVYMIGSGMTTGCNSTCTTPVALTTNCVDLAGLVTGGYLNAAVVSPTGATTWDAGTNVGGAKGSGYTLAKSATGIITIRACENERAGSTEISAAR